MIVRYLDYLVALARAFLDFGRGLDVTAESERRIYQT
jgi:hypothetical protein